jgi:glycerophosphoryl diester phosphodiesterase
VRDVQEIIAHRGASAHAPENTIEAFDLAVAQGADGLELDVCESGAGELVVCHDPADAPRACLTVDEVLARYGHRTRLVLDLKEPAPEWEGRLLVALGRAGLLGESVVQSFDHAALRRLHRAAPELRLAALYPELVPADMDLDGVASFADVLAPWHGAVDAELVAAAHARGLRVVTWTVNRPRWIERVLGCGADGVITDVPELALALRDRAPAVPLAA